MKKFALVIWLLLNIMPLSAQVNKGRISLQFNEKKIDIPISSLYLRKENNLLLSVRAEKNDSTGQQSVSLEMSLDKLADKNYMSSNSDFRLRISTRDNYQKAGINFVFNYGPKEAQVEYYYMTERINWQGPSLQFKIDITKVEYTGNELKITGSFAGDFNSKVEGYPTKSVAKISEGKFEIIL